MATTTNTVTLNANSAPAAVYEDERYVPFTYILTGLLADAQYTVKLHFAETYWTGAGERIFSVTLNGKYVLNDLDVFKTAGGENIAYDPQFAANADKYGQIIAQFIYGGADQPFINGIELVQSGSPTCTTIPPDPTGLTATASSSSVIGLSWSAVTPPANCSISSYSVYRSTTLQRFLLRRWNKRELLVASGVTGPRQLLQHRPCSFGTTYYYKVEAVDADGCISRHRIRHKPATTQSGSGGSQLQRCAFGACQEWPLATASSSSVIGHPSWTAVTSAG